MEGVSPFFHGASFEDYVYFSLRQLCHPKSKLSISVNYDFQILPRFLSISYCLFLPPVCCIPFLAFSCALSAFSSKTVLWLLRVDDARGPSTK